MCPFNIIQILLVDLNTYYTFPYRSFNSLELVVDQLEFWLKMNKSEFLIKSTRILCKIFWIVQFQPNIFLSTEMSNNLIFSCYICEFRLFPLKYIL